jgi:ferrous-iron efflux pump FieF
MSLRGQGERRNLWQASTRLSLLKVRKSGDIYHAELTITVDENLTVREAHEIADKVEKIIKEELGGDVSVHVEPSNSQKTPDTPPPSTSTSQ